MKTSDYVIGLVYRHPTYSSKNFLKFENSFNDVIEHLNSSALQYCIAGDFNIDLLKYMIDSIIKAYADMLLSNSCHLLIDIPTRITSSSATLIDHIISNNVSSQTICGIGLCDISDHLALFAIIPACYKCNKSNKRIIHDMRNFSQDHFLNDLCQQFNENLTPDANDPNAYFSIFLNLFSQIIDKHATRKPITRREQFSKRKPWITNGLLTSVKTKVRLLKRFVKFKPSESYNKYKRYRNLLNRVVKQAKICYYHLAINNSRGNFGKLWKVIRKLIQSRKPKQSASTLIENSNSEMESAELLNNYFVNIAENLAKKITVPNINHSHNNQDYYPHSFFLSDQCRRSRSNNKNVKN